MDIIISGVLSFLEIKNVLLLNSSNNRSIKNRLDIFIDQCIKKLYHNERCVKTYDYMYFLKYIIDLNIKNVNIENLHEKRICASKCVNDWRVSLKQLETLNYTEARNIHNRSNPMKMYLLCEILKLCVKRHNSVENMLIYQEKLLNRKNTQRQKRIEAMNKENEIKLENQKHRQNLLEKSLNDVKLSIRDDSRLCRLYIEYGDKCEYNLESVVKRVCEIHYLFNYVPKFLVEYNKYVNKVGYYDVVELAEYNCDVKYPEKWPWLL